VLVVRLDELGDLVLTVPFLRELRRNLPDASITLLVKPAAYNLMELCPYVDQLLTFDWTTDGRYPVITRHWRALQAARRALWSRPLDLAVVPRWDTDTYHAGFVAYFSGACWRLGYSENVNTDKKRLNANFDRLFTHVLNGMALKHEVARNLDIIRSLGGTVQDDRLELWFSPEDIAFGEAHLAAHGLRSDDMLIAFGPGKRDRKRRWPLSRFIELGS
jgi:heptosyltransferase-2